MSENFNEKQSLLIDTIDGMIVVDAGPGTGKTSTITERYVNIIKHDVDPKDILMLTFTHNAATEMTDRIKKKLIASNNTDVSKFVMSRTFDSFCSLIVRENSENIGDFFGFDMKFARNITLETNQTIIRSSFRKFYDAFLNNRGEDYEDVAILLAESSDDVIDVIERLMSFGITPVKNGWFGLKYDALLNGDSDALYEALAEQDSNVGKRSTQSMLNKNISKKSKESKEYCYDIPIDFIGKDLISKAVDQPRGFLFKFVHDVYLSYIKRAIETGNLTFGLNSLFAFIALYMDEKLRERNSFRYVMIDEFQDTNANQMMIAMMILKEPNLCVVGDWKQGIYGFRNVSIDNITEFEYKLNSLKAYLNRDTKRICFDFPEPIRINFDTNYRSSQKIIDEYFKSLTVKASKDDVPGMAPDDERITHLKAARTDLCDYTAIHYHEASSKDEVVDATIRCVKDYLCNDEYRIIENGKARPVRPGDIAIICRKNKGCRIIQDALNNEKISAYYQGDKNVMSTKEGKLVLAWLRYINDDNNLEGLFAILAHEGYTLYEMKAIRNDRSLIPHHIVEQRQKMRKEKRRINLVVTMIFSYYGLDNDITQSIISIISSSHRNSLLTISDLISMIETDIDSKTTYPLEISLDSESVSIMSAHKSKGLEFPIVIIPFVDVKTFPSIEKDRSIIRMEPLYGLRCTKMLHDFDGYTKVCDSLYFDIVNEALSKDYDEERRLMFVAMSRAKQYITMISGKPSQFFKDLSADVIDDIPKNIDYCADDKLRHNIEKPNIPEYKPRRTKWPVHGIMDLFSDGTGSMSDVVVDEVNLKGPVYGTQVHQEAQRLVSGFDVDDTYPEMDYIRRIVESRRDADILSAEVPCILPVPTTDVVLLGSIDMIALYSDRIEIHDWKTDGLKNMVDEYRIQLSVYAHSAGEFYRLPVKCFIHYVSLGETLEFDPLPMQTIIERVNRVKQRLSLQ